MQINIIAACDRNALIGINGKLPWSIPEDLKRFRELTLGHAVIMGRNTWESIGKKPLSCRLNAVLTSDKYWYPDEVLRSHSFDFLSRFLDKNSFKQFIIGGERLYTEAMPLADRVYLTLVDTEVEVGPDDTVARFPMEQMQALFRMESEDKRDGFRFTEWDRK